MLEKGVVSDVPLACTYVYVQDTYVYTEIWFTCSFDVATGETGVEGDCDCQILESQLFFLPRD